MLFHYIPSLISLILRWFAHLAHKGGQLSLSLWWHNVHEMCHCNAQEMCPQTKSPAPVGWHLVSNQTVASWVMHWTQLPPAHKKITKLHTTIRSRLIPLSPLWVWHALCSPHRWPRPPASFSGSVWGHRPPRHSGLFPHTGAGALFGSCTSHKFPHQPTAPRNICM